jgi:NTP pyrophosphatase (non-canonical NTP hydrolase)
MALQRSATNAPAARRSNFGRKRMFYAMQQASKSDSQLAKLLSEAREYAQVYVLARQRQKGCDGLGEMTNLKEEFRDVVDKVIQYSQEKKYISEVISYDIDSISDEIVKG